MPKGIVSTGPTPTKNYRGITRTGPGVLGLARELIHSHLMSYAEDGQMDEDDVQMQVDRCVAQLATWPETMTITYLLRDLDPEDFFHA
jgi:hypothetical protein